MTEPRRQRRWRKPQTHTHQMRQPGTRYIVSGGVLAIVVIAVMILTIIGYLADRRAVAEENAQRVDREVAEVRAAVCDALAVTVMGVTDPAALARADAAGSELGCQPPPSERDVDGYPVPTPVPTRSATTPAPQGLAPGPPPPDTPESMRRAPAATQGAPAAEPPPTTAPATVDPPAPAPAPSAPAPTPSPTPTRTPVLGPVVDDVCTILGVCLGD